MQKHYPYRIYHINLYTQPVLPIPSTEEQGAYLVFWWKDIALGHLFLEPTLKAPEKEYLNNLIEAIRPTISFYLQMQDMPAEENWPQWLLTQNTAALVNWLDIVLNNISQANSIEHVPVSVIICTRNRASYLRNCLLFLKNSACQPEEILVIDNAPSDESTFEVTKDFKDVKYIREPRIGLDIARNTGITNASYPVVAFVDDDVTIHPMWVYNVYQSFQNPDVAAITGLVIASQLETQAQLIFEKCWTFNRGYVDKVYDSAYIQSTLSQGPPVWEIGAGANMAFRKEVFKKVGLFDEILDVGAAGCNGDSEMWYRILINGYTIMYNPRAIVYHEHRKDMTGLKKQLFNYMRGYTAAALLQQQQYADAGYKRLIYYKLPRYYLPRIKNGFPDYNSRHPTIWVEIRGILSGLAFYFKNKNKSTRPK